MEIESLNCGAYFGRDSGMCHGSEKQPYQKVDLVWLDNIFFKSWVYDLYDNIWILLLFICENTACSPLSSLY